MLVENLPLLLVLAYVFWEGRTQQNAHMMVAKMREETERHRQDMDAIWTEQEKINAGLHKFLLQTNHPEAVALRERVETLQGKILRLRMELSE